MIDEAIDIMQTAVCSVFKDITPSLYLYDSVATGDYRDGWSDIDILCLTRNSLTELQANALLDLRQKLVRTHSNDVFRLFEGAFLPICTLKEKAPASIVYWGTSGQRITDRYDFTSFSMAELKCSGKLLCGPDVRSEFPQPTYDELRRDVLAHYQTIRRYAVTTDDSLYACGWLLDIARCLYTLRTGKVVSKTQAGEWSLDTKLCNVPELMEKTLTVRKNPKTYKNTPEYRAWASGLGPGIQRFADVLERELG